MSPTEPASPGDDEAAGMRSRVQRGRRMVTAVQLLAIPGGGVAILGLVDEGVHGFAVLTAGLVLLLLLVAVGVEALLDTLALQLPPED